MAAMTAASWGERAVGLLESAKTAGEVPSKLKQLRQLKAVLLHRDPPLLPEFVTRLTELQSERASPVRKFLAEMIGDIGSKHLELLPEMAPCLLAFLKDETPAVSRQAITTGTSLFGYVLEKLVIQGLYSSEIDDSTKSSWAWMLKFKDAVLHIAVQSGSDGVRLLAVKFVETLVLLYTPDPYISADPPQEPVYGLGFNISWLRGGHPSLNVGELAMEASQSLGLLLDHLRSPQVKSLSNSIIIVLIKSLSAIATKRPSFYGRILPVLLGLDPAISIVKGVEVPGAHHALKTVFVACLECTHSSAEPWRARLVEALKAINDSELAGQATNKNSGGVSISNEESLPLKDDNSSMQACDEASSDLVRKRPVTELNNDLLQDDSPAAKRIRQSTQTVQDLPNEPLQQLVAMFGALVAQGEKAAGSLEILISSISSDLLAEVVMANMQHLPPTCPKTDKDDVASETGYPSCLASSVLPSIQSSPLISDIYSLSSLSPLLASLLNIQPSMSHDVAESHQISEEKVMDTVETTLLSSSVGDGSAMMPAILPASVSPFPVVTQNGSSAVSLSLNSATEERVIPGVDSTSSTDEIQESHDASHSSNPEVNDSSQDHATSLGSLVPSNVLSTCSMATDVLETQSTGVGIFDTSQASSTASLVTSCQYVLPKMMILDVNLTDEAKDQLQKVAFVRILDAYKQVAISGGLDARCSLLVHLGIEFPLELDSWGLLQKHVLSDYMDHEGHELTLRILYRLYRETEQDQDFLSSRTAISIYETFLLAVAESLRDTFPATDKSLGRLLAEVPYLSEGVLKLLEGLCCPDRSEKHEKDFQSGDRVTQGLSAVWNLILLRPSSRARCLLIALQSAVHSAEEVRMKAIRLVANKLFPMPGISQKIEEFAHDKLHSVIDDVPAIEDMEADESTSGLQEDSKLGKPSSSRGQQSDNALKSSTHLDQNAMSSLISEAQRCMSLYFALCTKKRSLLREIFTIYKNISKAAKEAIHKQIPILVRTVGSSPELLAIISDPPTGSEDLLMQVLHTLTDGIVPSQDLISSVKKLYHSRMKDADVLIPVLPFLTKDEIFPIFPHLVNLPIENFQGALSRMLQGSPKTGPCLTPAEVLIAIHGIDPVKDGMPLKKVIDACSACFEQRKVFTQPVLAKVLNQLVEQIPLPLLFMRTVLQAIGIFPSLVDFVMEILLRLISKQIWKYPKLWVGFLKCAIQTMPQSFSVLLQLPAAQLENALNKHPVLRPPLVEHASQPNIRSSLPRSTQVVLGLVQELQASSQGHTSQSQAADTGSSTADVATELTQESSAVS
ncbi:hypothetical protein OPV22_020480 [Ensete ventricosum]|uniref:Symplekin C-terminal domain-containing protein n=1 Tax=Ensete ventricosum TaxID=4639 RepID=A0AAV8QKE7_ENSVE|nr:hypothetical protein OPV22_020480 [Ensete ventricosum]